MLQYRRNRMFICIVEVQFLGSVVYLYVLFKYSVPITIVRAGLCNDFLFRDVNSVIQCTPCCNIPGLTVYFVCILEIMFPTDIRIRHTTYVVPE
jgi:hypothetical protein